MRVVSENSEADLAHRRVADSVRWALRELAANLLCVVRGAGKPHEIGFQAQELINAFVNYREVVGYFPSNEDITSFLNVDLDVELLVGASRESRDRYYAKQRLTRGVLQIIASQLLGQGTHQTAGDREMHEGIRDLEAAREEQHQADEAALAAVRAVARGRAARPRKPKA